MALTELGAVPATYRHITTTVVTGAPAALALVRLRATGRFLVTVPAGLCRNAGAAALPRHGWRRSRPVCATHSAQLALPFSRGHLTCLIVTSVMRQVASGEWQSELRRM